MSNNINLSGFTNLQNNQIIKKDSVDKTEGLENTTIKALEGHYQNDDWNLDFSDGLDSREINVILNELDVDKDNNITDEEIIAFCENVGIAGAKNQMASLAKNLIKMVKNQDEKDIGIKETPTAATNSANEENTLEDISEEKTTSFEEERLKALEEYHKAVNNKIFQIRLEGASEYSDLNSANLNALYNGNKDTETQISADGSQVLSGNYAVFDITKNKYISIKNIDENTLNENLEKGIWTIRARKEDSDTFETVNLRTGSFRHIFNTKDDMAAWAKYNKIMTKIDREERYKHFIDDIKSENSPYMTEKINVIEEYNKAINNKIFQIRLDSAGEYSDLNISSLNALLNGDANVDYKLSSDRSKVESGNYAIFDTRTNRYVRPMDLKGDFGNSPDSILQQNLSSGAWVIRIPETKIETDGIRTRTVTTWSDLSFETNSSFRQTYYTADDMIAKAKYDMAMTEIKRKETELG